MTRKQIEAEPAEVAAEEFTPRRAPKPDKDGFELKPSEIVITFEKDGKPLVHTLSRRLNRGELMNIVRETSRQLMRGGDIYLTGELDEKYASAYDNIVVSATGYTLSGKPASLEEIKTKLPASSKRRVMELSNDFKVVEAAAADSEGVELEAPTPVVTIEAKQGEEVITLNHEFASNLSPRELQRMRNEGISFRSDERGEIAINGAGAVRVIEELYDAKIASVSGYLAEGRPLDLAGKEARKLIPIDHKLACIRELRRRIEGLDRD